MKIAFARRIMMSENAELWSRPDENSIRIVLECYLKNHSIDFDDSLGIEDLRKLYIDNETGVL